MLHDPPYALPIALCARHSLKKQRVEWVCVTLFFIICGCFALPHDLPLARYFETSPLPEGLNEVLSRSETFAHGIGVTAIFLILYITNSTRRWAFSRAILAVVSAGLASNGIKLLVGRLRPHAADLTASITDSFTGALPLFSVSSSERSTPSSHTAVVVAFAIALCWLYPRGKTAFISLAFLAALQRLTGGVHFLSDVFWGAAAGYFLGRGITAGLMTESLFNRWEARRYLAARYPHPDIRRSSSLPRPSRQAA